MYQLFNIYVFNPENGNILVNTTVAATTDESARNKAIAEMCSLNLEDYEVETLDALLDQVTVIIERCGT